MGDAHELGRRLAGVLGPRAGGHADARLNRILSSAAPAWSLGSVGQLRARPSRRGGRVASSSPSLPEVLLFDAASREPPASRVGLAPLGSRGVATRCPREPAATALS